MFGQAAIEIEHQADVGQVLDPAERGDVGRRRVRRHQIGDDRQRRRRQHGVGGDRRALGHDAADAAVDDRQRLDARAAVDRPAVRDDELRHLVGQRDEAAAIVGQLLLAALAAAAAAQLQLVPEPHRGDLLGERRRTCRAAAAPTRRDRRCRRPSAEPFGGGERLELAPVADAARPQRQQAEADAGDERQRREPQHVHRRRELEEALGVVHAGPRRPEHDLIALPQLLDELRDVHVVGEPVVVELLESRRPDVEAAGQAADLRVALEDGDADAALGQLVAGGQPAEAGPDDDDVRYRLDAHEAPPSRAVTTAARRRSWPAPGRMKCTTPASVSGSHRIRCTTMANAAARARGAP